MKKFIFMLVAMFATVTMSAQTVEKSKFLDNTYVGLNGGVSAWLHPSHHGFDNFGHSIRGIGSLRLGKFVTPILGFELEGEVGMANRDKFVDHTLVSINMLFNMNNVFHPYRGEPDWVEFVPFVGIGWHHTYGSMVSNNIASKFGMQVNFHLDKAKAWQINVIPSINYIMTDDGFSMPTNQPRFDVCRAHVNLQVGVTYKFKNSKKTHNFVVSPYCHTQKEFDDMNAKINELRKKNIKIVKHNHDLKTINKRLIEELNELKSRKINDSTIVNINVNSAIGFEIGSAKIPNTQRGNILSIAKVLKDSGANIELVGFADAATGSDKRNMELSLARANAVADALIECGVDKDKISVVGKGATEQIFGENDANRVVIFTTK